MRDALIAETFWTGETGRRLRSHRAEFRELAMLLLTGPGRNQYGLFYKTVRSMAEETGRTEGVIRQGLMVLAELEFAVLDPITDFVWVIEAAAFQNRPLPLHAGDYRIAHANRFYKTCPKNLFLGAFFDRYAEDLRLEGPRRTWEPDGTISGGEVRTSQGTKVQPLIEEEKSTSLVVVPKKHDARVTTAAGARFERFWQAWPETRRLAKKAARAQFDKINPDDALLDRMIAAVTAQKRSPKWQENNGEFIPYAERWLKYQRWEDVVIERTSVSPKTAATLDAARAFINHVREGRDSR